MEANTSTSYCKNRMHCVSATQYTFLSLSDATEGSEMNQLSLSMRETHIRPQRHKQINTVSQKATFIFWMTQ